MRLKLLIRTGVKRNLTTCRLLSPSVNVVGREREERGTGSGCGGGGERGLLVILVELFVIYSH